MKRKSGFTLIELLVVISIIALLLSILMPALSKVKEQAKKVVCATNMKQITTAFFTYAAENSDRSVPEPSTLGETLAWDAKMAPYFTATKSDSAKKFLVCPADRKMRRESTQGGSGGLFEETDPEDVARSYGPNAGLYNFDSDDDWFMEGNASNKPVKLANISQPGKVLYLIEQHIGSHDENFPLSSHNIPDAWDTGNIQGANYWESAGLPPHVAGYEGINTGQIVQQGDQHKDGGNWAWVDGSVSWAKHIRPTSSSDLGIYGLSNAYSGGPVYPFAWLYENSSREEAKKQGFVKY